MKWLFNEQEEIHGVKFLWKCWAQQHIYLNFLYFSPITKDKVRTCNSIGGFALNIPRNLNLGWPDLYHWYQMHQGLNHVYFENTSRNSALNVVTRLYPLAFYVHSGGQIYMDSFRFYALWKWIKAEKWSSWGIPVEEHSCDQVAFPIK